MMVNSKLLAGRNRSKAPAKTYTGIVFDFNGTMFRDNEFHIRAWMEFAARYGFRMTRDDYLDEFIGKTSAKALELLLEIPLDSENLHQLYEEKEAIYRALCLEDPQNFVLAPGLVQLLDVLADASVPMAIATASTLPNVEFFIDQFKLLRWFKLEHIVYDNGQIANKPAPDIYLLAAERLGLPAGELVVVEDSPTGAAAAQGAGAGCLVITGELFSFQEHWVQEYPQCRHIKDFHDFYPEQFFLAGGKTF
jgi:beta-phosphoglucomutase